MLLMLRDWEQIEVELHFCRSIMSTSPKTYMSYPFLTQLESDFCFETATLRQETLRIATKTHDVNHPCPCSVDILLCDSHHRIQIVQFVLSSPLLRCYSRREVEQMGGFQKIKTCGQPHQYLHYQKHDWSEAFSNIHVLGEGHFLSSINKQNKASYSHQPQLDVLRYPSSLSFSVIIPLPIIASKYVASCCRTSRHISRLSPSSRRSINRWSCIITEKAPTTVSFL